MPRRTRLVLLPGHEFAGRIRSDDPVPVIGFGGRTLIVAGDADRLRALLHPRFHWTSHTGERFNRDQYVEANTSGSNQWHSQTLRPRIDALVFTGEIGADQPELREEICEGLAVLGFRGGLDPYQETTDC
jgi:hypothetical protein